MRGIRVCTSSHRAARVILIVLSIPVMLGGCGGGTSADVHVPANAFPLISGASIARSGDFAPVEGNRFDRELVVIGPPGSTGATLKTAEEHLLRSRGWHQGPHSFPFEFGALSPDRRIALTIATPAEARHVSYYVVSSFKNFVAAAVADREPVILVGMGHV
jgi:hypothetical protein